MSRGSFLNSCLLKAIRTCKKMQSVLQAGVQKTLEHLDSLLVGRLSMGMGMGKERVGFAAHLEVTRKGPIGQLVCFSQNVLGVIKENYSAFATIK